MHFRMVFEVVLLCKRSYRILYSESGNDRGGYATLSIDENSLTLYLFCKTV